MIKLNLYLEVYEKLLLAYRSGNKPNYRLTFSESHDFGDFMKMDIELYVNAAKKVVFNIAPVIYEYSDRNDIIDEINNQIDRIYSVAKPCENRLFLNVCKNCADVFMHQNKRVSRARTCYKCVHRDIETTIKADVPKKASKVYLYLMKSSLTGLLKIGISQNPKRRKRNLETAQGGEIDILFLTAGSQALEKSIHKMFDKYRKDGEWFDYSEDIILYFEDIINGN